MLNGKNILITGGTGSLGKKLIQIIGESISSREVEAVMSRFEWEEEQLSQDDGFPEQRFLNSTQDGLSLSCNAQGRVRALYIYGEGHEGYARYQGDLIHGLGLDSSRSEVHGALGQPERSGEARPDSFLGPQGAWDRFLIEGVCVHVQYAFVEPGVSVVTLIDPDEVQ